MAGIACEGPTGPKGEVGEQGPEGPQGEEGTANVIYSEWLDVEWDEQEGDYYRAMFIEEERITNNFFNTGVVLVYLKFGPQNEKYILALPQIGLGAGGGYLDFEFLVVSGDDFSGIHLYAEINEGNPDLDNLTNYQVRYVLIPGGEPAKIPENLFEDYEAVAKYYGF